MAGFRSFRDCGAWQLAYALRRATIPLCRRVLRAKDFKLHGQIREAARSAPRNIAEGFARYKHKDFARFVRIAKGSEVELLNHFQEAFDGGYMTDAERHALDHAAKKAIKDGKRLDSLFGLFARSVVLRWAPAVHQPLPHFRHLYAP